MTVTGPAACDLLEEQRHHAAFRAEDVSQPNRTHACRARRHAQPHEFGETLGGTHNAVGVHGFVGGNHYESGSIEALGQQRKGRRCKDIVLHHGERIHLSQGNMFKGGGVIDDLGTAALASIAKTALIGNGSEYGDVTLRCGLGQVGMNVV